MTQTVNVGDLKAVFVIVRHGLRTPCWTKETNLLNVEFNDELLTHNNRTIVPVEIRNLNGGFIPQSKNDETSKLQGFLRGGKCLTGQLTCQGADDLFRVGQQIRRRYVEELHFLSENCREEIFVRSSNMRRTLLSARSILAGIFPNHNWKVPFPVHVTNDDEEIIHPCTSYADSLSNARQLMSENPGLIQLFEKIKQMIKVPSDGIDLFSMYDSALTISELGLSTPNTREILSEFDGLAEEMFLVRAIGNHDNREESLKALCGPLLDFILKEIELIITKKTKIKLHMICGHDYTLMRMLHVFGITSLCSTPPGSKLVLEIYEIDSKYYVQVFFNDVLQPLWNVAQVGKYNFDKWKSNLDKFRMSLNEYKFLCTQFNKPV